VLDTWLKAMVGRMEADVQGALAGSGLFKSTAVVTHTSATLH
jgi:hypothetical protein